MNKIIKKLKIFLKNLKKLIMEYKYESCFIALSIITLIVGTFVIGFLYSFLIIIIFNCLAIATPIVMKMIRRNKNLKKAIIEERKDEIILQSNINNYFSPTTNIIEEQSNDIITEKIEGVSLKKSKKKDVKIVKKNIARKKKKKITILKIILFVCIIGAILAFAAVSIFLGLVVSQAPKFNEKNFYSAEATILYDKDGEEIVRIGNQIRDKITYDELPEVLIDAIIATEDSRFFQHNGFDLPRFLKATLGQVAGKDAGGASTLTMQLAKNNMTIELYNMADSGIAGIKRKFTDIYVSIFEIEKNYTKEEIIELYVNSYNLGAGSYGVEQACLTYFGKHAKDISLAEAAMIAGLFQAPSAYNPYEYPESAEDRRQTVLYLMERHGYISSEERKIAENMTIDKLLIGNEYEQEFRSFVDTVVAEVRKDTLNDPYSVPMLIYTTMDRSKQAYLDDMFNNKTYKWENDVAQAGIAVTDVNTGAIVAIGGGRNKTKANSWNYATMIKNQIGSTSKPLYDYGPAIEFNNAGSGSIVLDDVHKYSDGNEIYNMDKKYNGFLTYREALKQSRNIPALKVFQSVSKKNINTFVTNLGLSPEYEDGSIHEAHSIGGYNGESPLTMAAAYAAFANGGYYIEPYSYTKIIYRDTQEEYTQKSVKNRAMSEETAYIINSMLQTNASSYGFGYINGERVGAKTGTSNFTQETKKLYKLPSNAVNDFWLVGITAENSIALWYGYDEIDSKYCNTSSGVRNKTWKYAADGIISKTNKEFPTSSGVVSVQIEKDCFENCVASEFTPEDMKTTELFKKGTAPTEISNRYSKLENVTNLSAITVNDDITLTWNPITIPNTINIEYISTYFKTIYSETSYQTKLDERIAYNEEKIGVVTYDIYLDNGSEELVYIATTTDSTYTYKITQAGEYKFVVKSSYTIFKDNASDGSIVTINSSYTPDLIVIDLIGDKNISKTLGTSYVDKGIIITNNGIDVTYQANYATVITDKMNSVISSIPNNVVGTYTITYTITYKGKVTTLTRSVTYTE